MRALMPRSNRPSADRAAPFPAPSVQNRPTPARRTPGSGSGSSKLRPRSRSKKSCSSVAAAPGDARRRRRAVMQAALASPFGFGLTAGACHALGVSRASLCRGRARLARPPASPPPVKPRSPRALSVEERRAVLDRLREPRFVDLAPAETYATLLDEGSCQCSIRTVCRIDQPPLSGPSEMLVEHGSWRLMRPGRIGIAGRHRRVRHDDLRRGRSVAQG